MQDPTRHERVRIRIRGVVQGVGFRPFLHRFACGLGLAGWVENNEDGVLAEVEGPKESLESFLGRLPCELPPGARLHGLEPLWLPATGLEGFAIRSSKLRGAPSSGTWVPPDIALCGDCRRELLDPGDRRHRHPFISCAHCGPRYTLIQALPYDRSRTSMSDFAMCDRCRAEYVDPASRRFHAEPIACPDCGPRLTAWTPGGNPLAQGEDALQRSIAMLRQGGILAVLGVGGFHLMGLACSEPVVSRLREGKRREAKPFAVMYPDLDGVRAHVEVSLLEARLLASPEAPIVLLARRETPRSGGLPPPSESVAPGCECLGVLLPSTPLHLLLLREVGLPVVATSGNVSGEPICADPLEAVRCLGSIVDGFLVHDRRILRGIDDSIVRVIAGREVVLRRARGYVPSPVGSVPPEVSRRARDRALLAAGADLKGAVAVTDGTRLILGQHLGDLETPAAQAAWQAAVRDLPALHAIRPAEIVVDAHPGYVSSSLGQALGLPLRRVYHHHAHVLSCVADNESSLPVLGVAWDGTGDGGDGTVWGGEFLRVTRHCSVRYATLRPFRLPGGEAAVREPRRAALGLLHEMLGEEVFGPEVSRLLPVLESPGDARVYRTLLLRGVQSPWTTSVGRLLDALASLLGLCHVNRFEGEGSMVLEAAASRATGGVSPEAYPIGWCQRSEGTGVSPALVVDWEPAVERALRDHAMGVPGGQVAGRFLASLVDMVVAVAHRARESRVVLTGGCFQNRLLTEWAVDRLEREGFEPLRHQRIPPNDGGIACGQIIAGLLDSRNSPHRPKGVDRRRRPAAHPPAATDL